MRRANLLSFISEPDRTVAATQNQKEVTINDAVNILDRSGNPA